MFERSPEVARHPLQHGGVMAATGFAPRYRIRFEIELLKIMDAATRGAGASLLESMPVFVVYDYSRHEMDVDHIVDVRHSPGIVLDAKRRIGEGDAVFGDVGLD